MRQAKKKKKRVEDDGMDGAAALDEAAEAESQKTKKNKNPRSGRT
jgi:hypothetical protein